MEVRSPRRGAQNDVGAVIVAVLLPLMALDRLDPPRDFFGSLVRLEEVVVWAALAWLAWRGRTTETSRRVLLWAAPLLGWVGLSHLINLPLHQAAPYWLRYTLLVWAIWAVLRGVRGRELRPIRLAIVASAAFALVIAAVQTWPADDRVRGLFLTATVLAGYVGLLAPLALAHALRGPRGEARWWWLTTAALVLTALPTLSRVGLLALGLGLALVVGVVWASTLVRRRLVAGVVATSLVGLALLVAVPMIALRPIPIDGLTDDRDVARVLPPVVVQHYANLRVPIWRMGLAMVADHPWFGIGGPSRYGPASAGYDALHAELSPNLGSYPDEAEREVWHSHAHQGAIQVAAQWGVPGLLAALVFVALLARHLWLGARHDVWALGALGALAALVAHNMLDYTLVYLAGEAGLLFGLGAGWSATAERDDIHDAGQQDPQIEQQ